MIRFLLTLPLFISSLFVSAQHYGIQVGADYDSPVGHFAFKYKPTQAYHIDILWFSDNNTINFSLSKNNFKPKEEPFYFLINEGEDYGIEQFSDYKATAAYIGWMHNFPLSEVFKFGLGFNFGVYGSHYTTERYDGVQNYSGDIGDMNVYLAAKTGCSFDLSEKIQLSFQAKYNGFSPTGKNDPSTPAFNGHIGTVNYTWSTGLALAYKIDLR